MRRDRLSDLRLVAQALADRSLASVAQAQQALAQVASERRALADRIAQLPIDTPEPAASAQWTRTRLLLERAQRDLSIAEAQARLALETARAAARPTLARTQVIDQLISQAQRQTETRLAQRTLRAWMPEKRQRP